MFGVHVHPPRLTARRAPLRRALYQLTALATTLAVTIAYFSVDLYPQHALTVAAYPVVGLAFVAIGAIASSRRPSNPTGTLMIVTGALTMVSALNQVDETHLVTIGNLFAQLPIAAFLHLVLAFPAGRLERRFDLVLVALAYVLTLALQLQPAFPSLTALIIPRNVSLVITVLIFSATAARLAMRIVRTERRSERRVLLIGSVYGTFMLLFFVLSARVIKPLLDLDDFQLFSLQLAFFVFGPFIYAAGILRGGFGRAGELDELAGWLGSDVAGRSTLREALASVLGDPSLQVLFAGPDGATQIDADGRSVTLPSSPWRGREQIRAADDTVTATLDYDRTLLADPRVVQEAGRVVAIALERERLQAELLAEREALRASRTRVVEVGDLERRKLAQDLHDVMQSRLTLAAMHAGTLAADSPDARTRNSAERLRLELDGLITEFRSMVHGVMPALLVERGLAAAVEDLVDRQPMAARLRVTGHDELPPLVSTTAYFIIAEAVHNAVRHGQAETLEVAVDQCGSELLVEVRDDGIGGATPTGGAGLRGIADRVGALNGTFRVDSPPGAGTTVSVVLPCGW